MIVSDKSTGKPGLLSDSDNLINIYPNPADDFINILSGKSMTRIEIISLLGQVMIGENAEAHSYKVNISELEPGMYVVKVLTQDGNTLYKQFLVK